MDSFLSDSLFSDGLLKALQNQHWSSVPQGRRRSGSVQHLSAQGWPPPAQVPAWCCGTASPALPR